MSGESSLTINKKRHRRARGISETDSITDKMVEAASSKGIDADQAKRIYEQFRDYHIAKGSTFKDWDAAFRTWLRNAERFGELPKPQRKAGDWQWHEDKGCWHRRSWNEVAQCYGDEWR